MLGYTIGLSGLVAGQAGINLAGHNIANANTAGYHRQRLGLASVGLDGRLGQGVAISQILRYQTALIRSNIVSTNGESARLGVRLDSQQQSETTIANGPDSINNLLNRFFNQVEQLTAHPEDTTLRRLVVSAAGTLAGRFNAVSSDLDRIRVGVRDQINHVVSQVNELTPRIAELNGRIAAIEAQGGQANDLHDQRDQLIDELSHYVEIRTQAQPHGVVNVIGPGTTLVVGTASSTLSADTDVNGQVFITANGDPTHIPVRAGSLSGLLEEYNVALPAYASRINSLARAFIQSVNAVQATGLGSAGPQTNASGTTSVTNSTIPLSSAGLVFPVQAGQIALSVTNVSTGVRTLTSFAFDPATQSLQDFTAAVATATGGQVTATIDASTGTLRLQAQAGFAFDFAGRLPTNPVNLAINGTTVPTVAGSYTGSGNDNYSFAVLGSGTIGVTAGLQLEVRNSANVVVATLNIGDGYTPGTALTVANGVTVSLSAGTSNAGTFSVPVTGQPDTTGLLGALGVNSLFTGNGAANIAVNGALSSDPGLLAVSRSGQPGDASNLERFAGLRDTRLLTGGTQTLDQYFQSLLGEVGSAVQGLGDQQSAIDALQQQLFVQEQSVIGVDVNEESVNLVQYQRLIESSAKYLSVVNTALDTILQIVR